MTKWSAAGKFRHTILLQTDRSNGQTTSGQHVQTWSTYTTAFASIEPSAGADPWIAQQAVPLAGLTHVIKTRFQSGIHPQDRAVYRGRIFNILYALNLEERDVELWLYCSEDITNTYRPPAIG